MSKRLSGIYKNCDPIDQPEGFYRHAENMILDEETGSVINEKGTSAGITLPDNSRVIGSYLLTDDTQVVFLNTNEIGLFSSDGYQTIYASSLLNFSNTIQADLYIDKNGDRVITWVDGENPARFLNIDAVGTPSKASLNLFPSIEQAPKLEITNVNDTGGSLKTGTYYIAIAYKHTDETLTNFYDVVGPIPIIRDTVDSDELFRGSDDSLETSKSISMSFSNIDTEYESMQLAVIPVYGGVIDAVQLLPEIPITAETYTYTGGESFKAGSLEEIQIDQAFYSKPKTLHINDDTIYLGNMEQQRDIGYQKYAKDITVQATSKTITNSFGPNGELENSFRNPINSVYNKSFKRGEVYALYISWILKEGGESKAYHIPGRSPEPAELQNDDFRYFSSPRQFPTIPPTQMGYWENENETYPNDSDTWGTLAGEKVRHHHFPEASLYPLQKTVATSTSKQMSVLGFKLKNIQLPPEIKEQVTGYKIYYAKRTKNNKRIVDQTTNIQSRLENDLFRPQFRNIGASKPIEGVFVNTVYYMQPFHLLRTRESIGQITHLKAIRRCIDETVELEGADSLNFDHEYAVTSLRNSENVQEAGDKLKSVESISYVDSKTEVSNISLTQQGFPNNMDNNRGESKIIVEIDSAYNGLNQANTADGGPAYYLLDLFSYKENVYNSFDNQLLESTNYIHTDIDTLADRESDAIFGGDTFINIYTYRVQKRYDNVNYVNVIHLLCESEDNISYRRVGDNAWEGFYPHFNEQVLSALAWKDGQPVFSSSHNDIDFTTYDNYFHYNEDYSKTNDIRFPTLKEKLDKEPEEYPTRVIRNKGNTSRLTRVFLPDDYIDLTTKRGELVKLTTYNNILIPHMERSLIRTKGREELQVGDIRAFLGSGDIFGVKPEELIYSEDGFGGIEAKEHSISTPYGYAFYDKDAHKMFLINHDGMQDIGEPIKPVLDAIEPLTIRLGYDPKFERLFITFDNETWSYSFKIQGWISKHSFVPNWYLNTKDTMYTNANSRIYTHNIATLRGRFYSILSDSSYTYVDNRGANTSKVVMSLMINASVHNTSGKLLNTKTFDQFRIQNSIQDTGLVDIEYFANEPLNPYIGNARKTMNKWYINQFRDITAIPDGTQPEDEWKYKKKLEDHYHTVELIKKNDADNGVGEKVTLTDTDLIYKESIR